MTDSARVARTVRAAVQDLDAYVVPDAAGMIKLDAMENPYPWPGELVDEWLAGLRAVELNRYPDGLAGELKTGLAEFLDVPPGADLLLGNGSDELIQIVQAAVNGPVLALEPSFVMYRQIAAGLGREFLAVPLAGDFSLPRQALLETVARHRPGVVFIAWPSNPTANLFDADDVAALIDAAPGVVVLDEAYHAYADASFMPRLGEFENLVIMRTLSKLGLAGLRLGVLAGDPAWIGEFEKLRLPYNIGTLTQASVSFALRHAHVLRRQVDAIRAQRARLIDALQQLPGFTVFPSQTNFVLFRCEARPAGEVFAALRRAGVLIRNLDGPGVLAGCLRVTVGMATENDAFLDALREIARG